MIYADVIVNITAHALDRPFQYRIPEALRDKLEVGSGSKSCRKRCWTLLMRRSG